MKNSFKNGRRSGGGGHAGKYWYIGQFFLNQNICITYSDLENILNHHLRYLLRWWGCSNCSHKQASIRA